MTRFYELALMIAMLVTFGCGESGGDAKNGSDKKGGSEKSSSGKSDSGQKGGDAQGAGGSNSSIKIDGEAQSRSGIRVEQLQLRSIPLRLMAAGQITVNEDRSVRVDTYTDGRITEVLATVGDSVKRGQVLARMHSHALHETRASYEVAVQDVKQRQRALEYSQRLAVRMHNLFAVKSASLQEAERADADVLDARTNLQNAEINSGKEREHLADLLRIDPAQVPAAVSEDLDVLPILSSITGTVITRKITPGSVVQPGEETFTVADLSSVWMLAAINESDIGRLRPGRHARLVTQAFPDRAFDGVVMRLGSELDPQTRTLQARVVVPNPRRELRPAMFANAEIEEGSSRQALFVPEEAIQDINGGPVVFLRVKENEFVAQPVQIAHTLNGEVEIASGLKAGDNVVSKGSFVVKSELLKAQIGS